MAETRGVWSLSEAWGEKSADEWINFQSVWLPLNQNVGYQKCLGPAEYKFNFSTTTTTLANHLTTLVASKSYMTGTSNSTHAWYNGGYPFTTASVKITYATDASANSPSSRYTYGRKGSTGLAGQSHTYFVAGVGDNPHSGPQSTVTKLVYSNDSLSNLPGSALASARYDVTTGTGGGASGYVFAGMAAPVFSTLQKITFSNDTRSSLPASSNLNQINENSGTQVPKQGAGKMQCTTHCYYAGGSPSGSNYSSTVQKLTFSNETWSVNPGKMSRSPNGVKFTDGITASPSQGAICGGSAHGNSSGISIVDMVTFATDTWATEPSMQLPAFPSPGGGYSPYTNGTTTSIHDSMHSGTPGLPTLPERWFDNTAASPNFGYSATGRKSSNWAPGPAMEFTYKVNYDTDTSSNSPSAGVSYGLEQSFGAGNSTECYKIGGRSNDVPSDGSQTTEKITYATDTRSSSPNHTVRRYGSFAVTNGTTNLITTAGQGQSSNQLQSNSYKLTYSSGSWSSIPAQPSPPNGNVTSSKRKAGAVLATSTNGYFAGGGNGQPSVYSNVDKFVFSNDTQARVPAANLTQSMDGNRGFSRGDAGYSMGGLTGGGDYITNIDKITFSTDTTAAFPSNLPLGVQANQTMSSNSTGYATGGQGPSPSGWDHSAVSKMSFATGTFSASGNLPTYQHHGIGMSAGSDNLPFVAPPASTPATPSTTNLGIPENGYIAGGYGNVSSISKLDMASETYTRLTTALSETNRRIGGFGDLTKGYAAAGTQPVRSWCQKLVYSTETRTTLPSQMQSARGYLRAIGNNTAGYVGGGTPQSSQGTKMDKMPYSTETFSSLPNIPTSRYRYASLGNQDKGYFAGGYPNAMSKVTKITYSNDSYATTPTLSYAATFQTGAGNATKGYVVSGEGGGTKVDKITFSNDTTARVPSADLSAVRYAMDGNNSPTKAYFTGGSPGVKTNTEVITFSNDTTALSSTANADTGDNQAGAYAAFGPNHCGNPGSDIQPNII